MEIKSKRKQKGDSLLILLCWLVYTCSYLGKYSYSSNMVVVISYYDVTKADAGLISTLFFIAYGAGQIFNGIFCKYYPKKYVVGGAVAVSAIVNLILFFDVPFGMIKYLWFINGVAQSVLWPTLVLTLSSYLPGGKLKSAVLVMSTTVAVGTVISYGLSALFAETVGFHFSFLVASAVLLMACILWMCLYARATLGSMVEGAEQEPQGIKPQEIEEKEKPTLGMLVMLAFLAAFAIVNNLVKDGLNTWVPNILKERYGLGEGLSILLTISLSILGIFGSFVAVGLHKKIKNFLALAGVLFAGASVCLISVILLFQTELWVVILIVFGLISLLTYGINNVVTSMSPLYLRGKINAGFLSGVMNGACYVGSALSSYGLGGFADTYGWNAVFYLLLTCCFVATATSLVVWLFLRKKL